jgi:hypothetical protein
VRRATTIFHIQPGYCRHEELHNFHGPAAKWPMPRGKAADDEIQPFLDRIYLRLRISERVAVASCVGAMFCLLFGLGNSSEAVAKPVPRTSHRRMSTSA